MKGSLSLDFRKGADVTFHRHMKGIGVIALVRDTRNIPHIVAVNLRKPATQPLGRRSGGGKVQLMSLGKFVGQFPNIRAEETEPHAEGDVSWIHDPHRPRDGCQRGRPTLQLDR